MIQVPFCEGAFSLPVNERTRPKRLSTSLVDNVDNFVDNFEEIVEKTRCNKDKPLCILF